MFQGELPFLLEIMHDLQDDVVGKSERILNGIQTRTFPTVATAALIVKGSAMFFYCGDLISASKKLIELAREGLKLGPEGLVSLGIDPNGAKDWNGQPCRDPKIIWVDIEKAYAEFEHCVDALNVELEAHFRLLGV